MNLYRLFAFMILISCSSRNSSEKAAITPYPVLKSNHSDAMPDSVAGYIQSALDVMQHNSTRKKHIDAPELRSNTFLRAKGATTLQQTYPAVKEALKALGDHHSFFKTPNQHKQWQGNSKQSTSKSKASLGMMLAGKVALLAVPAFSSGDPAPMQSFASQLQAKI
jgi:carboxyl-terminal processing protease